MPEKLALSVKNTRCKCKQNNTNKLTNTNATTKTHCHKMCGNGNKCYWKGKKMRN